MKINQKKIRNKEYMAVEIELKARLDDPEPVKTRLFSLGKYLRAYKKSDVYWLPAEAAAAGNIPPSGVRVRREKSNPGNAVGSGDGETVLVTYKTKEVSDGIEVNDEREFTISDATVFEDLLERLGLAPGICKEKRGWAWELPDSDAGGPPVLAELSLVAGLGWFIELEILAPDLRGKPGECGEKTVARCRERLLVLLEKLGIGKDQIEERPYSQLLRRELEKGR
jgi:adenylate cyclase class 2